MAHFHPASVDTFIAGRLPDWLTSAQSDRLRGLHMALREHEHATYRLSQLMKHIPPLDQFALPLLNEALSYRGVSRVDARKCKVRVRQEKLVPTVSLTLQPLHVVTHTEQVLLAAALHNYHIADTRPSTGRAGQLVDEEGKRLPIGFTAFAGMCRALDLGQRYQALLEQHLRPKDAAGAMPGTAALQVRELFENSVRAHFEVDVRKAFMRGSLSEDQYLSLLPVMSKRALVPPLKATVTARQLNLLGKQVRGVATFEVNTGSASAVLAWLPGDPNGAMSAFSSWQALYDALARRLTARDYQAYFFRFISERDRPKFHQLLLQRLAEGQGSASAELDGRHLPIDRRCFEHLAILHIDKLFDDARVLAVPTGDEDEQDRLERLQVYAAFGMELVNLAGMFIPVVGELLLVAGALEIANEVYEGYQDWQLGDRQGALDHLFGVAETVALGALVATGGAVVLNTLERVGFVDDLVPVRLASGQTRLSSKALTAYRVDSLEAQAEPGEGRTQWLLNIDDANYRVVEDTASETAHIAHPVRKQAYTPEVFHNRAGGWFHELEHRQSWQHGGLLLRRMKGSLAEMPEATAEQLLRITGYDQAHIRRLHLENVGLPARIADAWELYQLHEQLPQLQGESLDSELIQRESALTEPEQQLRRNFPGLSAHGTREILAEVTDEQLESLEQHRRVPLSLAQKARWHLREQRIDRACAALQWERMENADTERLAMSLVAKLAPWPKSVRVELREAALNGRLLIVNGPADASELRTIIKRQGRYQLAGSTEPQGLLAALRLTLDDDQVLALVTDQQLSVQALRSRLVDAAAVDREAAGRLIGMAPADHRLRLPRRFADGRSGYPLSGGGESSRRAIRSGIHRIYPTLTDQQVNEYLEGLARHNVGLWEHYVALDRNFAELRLMLHTWRGQAQGIRDALRRYRVAQQLRRCWRRKITNHAGEHVLEIIGERVGHLPDLPTGLDFGHVRRLRLSGMELTELPHDFLARFPNLLTLDLRGNRLEAIPPGIECLTQLRQLRLSDNRLTIDAAAQTRLDALQRLQRLDLARNPLGHSPSLTRMPQLRRVSLRATQLTEFPMRIPPRAYLDLRENRIIQLRQDLRVLRDRLERTALHENPLDEPSQRLVAAVHEGELHRGGAYRHRDVNELLLSDWLGSQLGEQRDRYTATWEALRAESGSSDLFRFLADFANGSDFEQHPGHYRRRVWSILDYCERHEPIRERVFQTAGGRATCDDRLLYILGELELAVQAGRALDTVSSAQLEPELWRLGRAYSRLDEVDRIAARHIERMRAGDTQLVDDIEVRFSYRTRLARALGLPIEEDTMHYEIFANVTTRDLLDAEHQVLTAETPQVLADSLAQRTFWQAHAHEHYAQRFDEMLEDFQVQLEQNQSDQEAGLIDEWQYSENARSLRHEYEQAERELYRTLANELQQRLNP